MASLHPRRLPRVIAIALVFAWRAAPRELPGVIAAQLTGAGCLVLALLLGRHLLAVALRAQGTAAGLDRTMPAALPLTATTAAIGVVRALANRWQRLLGESHRFSTVWRAARICVLEHGSITESGTHEQLAADDGLYSPMFEAQAAPYR